MDIFTLFRAVLKCLPARMAYRITAWLAELPPRVRPTDSDKKLLKEGQAFTFGGEDRKRYAWSFGSGPLVICMHGWGGLGAHMIPLAKKIAEKGFLVVVFDVTGHGYSTSMRVAFRDFSRDLKALTDQLDREVYALVGHSAGALCMMASRELEGISAKKYVCISAPIRPYPPLIVMRKKLHTPEKMIEKYSTYLAQQFEHPWEKIPEKAFSPEENSDLIILHDTTDKFVAHDDADTIHRIWPRSTVIKTSGNTHRNIIWSSEVMDRVASFIQV
jgi:pimeloyl-ACP methyl ester carboxylesterase